MLLCMITSFPACSYLHKYPVTKINSLEDPEHTVKKTPALDEVARTVSKIPRFNSLQAPAHCNLCRLSAQLIRKKYMLPDEHMDHAQSLLAGNLRMIIKLLSVINIGLLWVTSSVLQCDSQNYQLNTFDKLKLLEQVSTILKTSSTSFTIKWLDTETDWRCGFCYSYCYFLVLKRCSPGKVLWERKKEEPFSICIYNSILECIPNRSTKRKHTTVVDLTGLAHSR